MAPVLRLWEYKNLVFNGLPNLVIFLIEMVIVVQAVLSLWEFYASESVRDILLKLSSG